jgi:hypothetical protein
MHVLFHREEAGISATIEKHDEGEASSRKPHRDFAKRFGRDKLSLYRELLKHVTPKNRHGEQKAENMVLQGHVLVRSDFRYRHSNRSWLNY